MNRLKIGRENSKKSKIRILLLFKSFPVHFQDIIINTILIYFYCEMNKKMSIPIGN